MAALYLHYVLTRGGGGLQKQKLTRQTMRKMVTNELVWKMRINIRILMLKV